TSGYVVLRGPGPSNGFLALNAGPYVEHELESHSHLAVTDFVLSAWHAPLALEAGGPSTYDDPVYHQWYRTPAAHNMVTLDGLDIATDRRARVDHVDVTGRVQVVEAHHDGYPYRIRRRIVFVGVEPIYWLISDEIAEPTAATWSILGPAEWHTVAGGHRSAGTPNLTVLPATPPDAVSHDVGPGQIPGPESTAYGDLHALRLHSSSGRFDVLLIPSRDEQPPWRIEAVGTGWRIAGDSFVDLLSSDGWQRQSTDGEIVDSERWADR
ncbi:MAG TPA: heparinase II/III family protein, partial [Micromonosporaceae bacterium]